MTEYSRVPRVPNAEMSEYSRVPGVPNAEMAQYSRVPGAPNAEMTEYSRVPGAPNAEMTWVLASTWSTKSWNDWVIVSPNAPVRMYLVMRIAVRSYISYDMRFLNLIMYMYTLWRPFTRDLKKRKTAVVFVFSQQF